MSIISNFQFSISNFKNRLRTFNMFNHLWVKFIGNWKLEIGNSPLSGVGFTLIELIIVIGIMGIFATGIIATLNPYDQYKKAQDAKRKSELSQIQKALESYYQDTGSYPLSSSDHKIQVIDEDTSLLTELQWGGSWQPYMNVLPKDPGGSSYVYYSVAPGQSYYLYASLERGAKDPDTCSGLVNDECPGVSSLSIGTTVCGGNPCNFGVSSPNVTP
jgi:general secretion pathway protein G